MQKCPLRSSSSEHDVCSVIWFALSPSRQNESSKREWESGREVDGLRGRGDPAPGIPGESCHAWGFGTRWIPYTFLNLRECVSSSKKYLFK